ncbi:MAG: DUF896 domain-containing protein [Oscillospiraceae bacterium]|nr:DUF896 domain-containing protein [Oscillospiraceae bacterium]
MATERLERINELARKAKNEGLTDEEKAEQKRLRAEYLAAFRANVEAQLENTYIVDEDGNERKLKKKDD